MAEIVQAQFIGFDKPPAGLSAASVGRAFRFALGRTAQAIVADLIKNRVTSATTPSSIHRRSGELARGLNNRENIKVRGTPTGTLFVEIGPRGVPYGAVHEFGGTITPKRARALAIPLAAAKTAAGVSRYKSPRDVPGLFVLARPGRPTLLVKQEGGKQAGARLTPYFALVQRVTIPPGRLGLRETIRKFVQGSRSFLASEIQKALETERGGRRG